MNTSVQIGLVEDQKLFREGMKAILISEPDFKVIFESADGFSVMGQLAKMDIVPDVMLVDLSLPPDGVREYSGIHVTDALLAEYKEMKVIILSVHDDQTFISELIEHGAHGYLAKDCDPNEVIEAIKSVHAKGSYINQKTLLAIQNKMKGKIEVTSRKHPHYEDLTKREIEVLQLVCEQLTAEEIGERLFISEKTVNGHKINLLRKTQSRNTAGLVLYALKKGIFII